MAMGETGMAEMSEMSASIKMEFPENTLPMMTGTGQFVAIEMGGMFTTVKVRESLSRNDYVDPGPYKNPPVTLAREVENDLPPIQRSTEKVPETGVEMKVRKPTDHSHH